MEVPNFKIAREEYDKIVLILSHLHKRARASSVCLINRNGQDIAHEGQFDGLDIQALSSLAASTLAATFGLASLIQEEEFQRIYHRGRKNSLIITPVAELALLLIVLPTGQEDGRDLASLGQAILILEDILRKCSSE